MPRRCASLACATLLLLSGAWALASGSEAMAPPEEAALATDDECHTEQCTLNALQLKARPASVEAGAHTASNETAASDMPLYEESLSDYEGLSESSNETGPEYEVHAESATSRGPVVTGYHQTSPAIGRLILRHGFRPGHAGYCGGGIYFAASALATTQKAVGHESHHGFLIEVRIDLGRVKHMGRTCMSRRLGVSTLSRTPTSHFLHQMHADSFVFNPIDGTEYVIANPRRVISMRQVR